MRLINPEMLRLPMYYDRAGFPIPCEVDADVTDGAGVFMPTLSWAQRMQDHDYRVVACDDLPDGSYLSTVWLGLDHSYGFGRPLIFETMRFHPDTDYASRDFPDPYGEPGETTEQLRYTTEEEAFAAHHEIVRRIRVRDGH
jgi:hypothetical protein